ncbi:TPA: hypothetical protein PXI76_002359 [Yersinia enterocolitica]|uniref:hypothetical protein n=1 Tax=Yersinia enterocolitica TaxID=630 RepID=UPI0005E1F03E|nr:hypothetical protein [Yersinia enterocolitica]CNK34208.1 Uncharacterised protein [Yersinia enterocolitica]HDL6510047.1 hypothetical protein [Yersinia enterocolitica]
MPNKIKVPLEGLYVSSLPAGERIVVTEVSVVDDDEDDEVFFLVTFVEEGDENDMSAPGFELNPEEWQQFVKENKLTFVG